ncbi:hypothetical protein Pcinc_006313 [Petrolisthes cinctipes]|uniref:Uncharacterized protein n=1 Tax=Petrolisthes cinctipes TaxID=88211 RepID=A0AAE1KZB2_PETCI|nr:hypothetical protein Pcinc_006313 [Petrolisthes cinctipes]
MTTTNLKHDANNHFWATTVRARKRRLKQEQQLRDSSVSRIRNCRSNNYETAVSQEYTIVGGRPVAAQAMDMLHERRRQTRLRAPNCSKCSSVLPPVSRPS